MSSSSSGSGAFLAAAAGCSTSMPPSVIFSEQQTRPLRMRAPWIYMRMWDARCETSRGWLYTEGVAPSVQKASCGCVHILVSDTSASATTLCETSSLKHQITDIRFVVSRWA